MDRRSAGFTLIELVVVLLFVAVIAALTIPNYLSLVRKTHVMQVVADVQAVRAAAYIYYGDTLKWPREAAPGVIPPELADRLPSGTAFTRPDYMLDWDNWYTVRGRLLYPGSGIGVGIGVVSDDATLVDGVQSILANAPLLRISPIKVSLRIAGANGI
jgi:prepilin-type N-terminal cleavage/methylation domain-containing protein